ncbi:MAG: hypothetical protein MIO92_04345 [Methanosarcinaceae archaeon]|nr:hypothetical protein [Methanosarcinaceae archaeon]
MNILHLCRHCFATTLLERGVDIVTISSILGHSKMMPGLLYSHTDREKKKPAVEFLTNSIHRLSDTF